MNFVQKQLQFNVSFFLCASKSEFKHLALQRPRIKATLPIGNVILIFVDLQ